MAENSQCFRRPHYSFILVFHLQRKSEIRVNRGSSTGGMKSEHFISPEPLRAHFMTQMPAVCLQNLLPGLSQLSIAMSELCKKLYIRCEMGSRHLKEQPFRIVLKFTSQLLEKLVKMKILNQTSRRCCKTQFYIFDTFSLLS